MSKTAYQQSQLGESDGRRPWCEPSIPRANHDSSHEPGPKTLEAPNLIAAIAHQTHILQKIANVVAPDPSHEPFIKKFKEFYKLKPPTFDHADNPIEADDWLCGIKRRLELVKCTDKEGLNIVTLQLRGIANSWWD